MKTKKILSMLLVVCLLLALLPTAALATGTDKAIQLVASGAAANIAGAQANNVYFGTYPQSSDGNGGYNDDPIKWRRARKRGREALPAGRPEPGRGAVS
jgi:hypothetical protein